VGPGSAEQRCSVSKTRVRGVALHRVRDTPGTDFYAAARSRGW